MCEAVVYAIENAINGKRYIGSTINRHKRWAEHIYTLNNNKHSNPHLQNAWNKYGQSTFAFIVLETLENMQSIVEREQHYIDSLNAVECGYNIREKAGRHAEHSREARRMIGQANKRRVVSAETKAKISAAKEGIRHSQATIIKITEALRGRKLFEEHKAKISAGLTGKTLNQETREKISASRTGFKHSEETREKIRANNIGMTGKKHSPEAKAKMSAAKKKNKI